MSDRGNIVENSRPEEGGQREWLRAAAPAMARFLLGFLLAAGRFAGTMAPFGTALVAHSGTGLGGLGALSGACLGYLATGGLDWGIRYAAACVLAFTLSFIIGEERMETSPWIAPCSAFAVTAATGALGRLAGGMGDVGVAAEVLIESLLSGAAAFFFREALSARERQTEGSERRREAAVAVLAACALTALARVHIAGTVSLGRVIALLLVMASSLKGGCMAGAAAGTAFGLAMDAAGGAEPFFTMAYAFAGLVSGVFARYGRLTFLLSFVLADALCAACCWRWTPQLGALFEVFAASVVFMLIPPAALARLSSLLQPMAPGMGESGLRRYAARRVEGIARAYGDVCEVVRRNTADGNDNDIARVFDRAADVSCVKCKKRGECWTKGYMETLDALNSATEAMAARGALEEEDIPEWFRRRCLALPQFVAAVNAELRALAFRRQYRSYLAESRAAAWAQYEDFAEILAGVAREIGSVNGADPLAERRLMRYLRSLDIEADAAVFRDGGGRLRAVVESGRLGALTKDPAYLDKLSAVLGVRLCRTSGGGEGRLTLLEAEPLTVSVGIAAMKKRGESVNGDKGTYFKTDGGVLCVILSDGMGAGSEAAEDSGEAVAILERFLRSGVDGAAAMKILNSVMLLRNGEEWGFATADLMCVDLFTGETCFYKYGAAPSYVKTGKSVRRIAGESLAAGMTGAGASPDTVRMRLKPGSLALVASDGVSPGLDDGWLLDMLRETEEPDVKALARAVLRRAADEYGNSDDMTVLAVRVDERI